MSATSALAAVRNHSKQAIDSIEKRNESIVKARDEGATRADIAEAAGLSVDGVKYVLRQTS